MIDFCHLHLHDQYSLLDGVGTSDEYSKLSAKLGMKFLAQTNHGNINGSINHQKSCLANGVTPVFGCEGYIIPDFEQREERNGHVVLLVKNKTGWENLLKMLNVANSPAYFYKRPRFDYKLLIDNCEGLKISTACISSFVNQKNGIDFLIKLNKRYPGDVYLELMPFLQKEQIELNKKLLQIHKKTSIPMVITNDCHYPNFKDSVLQDVLLAIQTKVKWDDPKRWRFDYRDLYLKSPNRMFKQMMQQGVLSENEIKTAMSNSIIIAEDCRFKIEKTQVSLPTIKKCLDEDLDPTKFFVKLCRKKLIEFIKNNKINAQIYQDRFKMELEVILSKKFEKYFLIVWELINWAKQNDILIGPGRGSVSGSLIAYLIGITAIDPIKHTLLFERFISMQRDDFPDIDIDVEAEKRSLIKNHLFEEYGSDNVANISTYLQMKGKMVIRDVSRVFDISTESMLPVIDLIEDDIGNVFEDTEAGKKFKEKYDSETDIIKKLEGQIRAMGSHAGGFIIAKDNLKTSGKVVLLQNNENISINWNKYDAEFIGLLKLDLLGLSGLSIIKDCVDMVEKNTGKKIDLFNLDLFDERIFKEFCLGNTIGCFQFNTEPLSNICKIVQPKDFNSLVNLVALYRPALIQRGMVEKYIQNKKSGWSDSNKTLNDILQESHGIILYQEQLMLIVKEVSGMSLNEAEEIRKTFNKSGSGDLQKYEKKFIDGSIKNGLKLEQAQSIWNYLSANSGYGFNKSHSVGYAMLSFIDMYLKVNFPKEFICASLNYSGDDKKQLLITEALRLGIKVCSPKVNKSSASKWEVIDGNLYCPFIEIKGIGPSFAQKLEKSNSKEFFSDESKLPSSIMEKIKNPTLSFEIPQDDSAIFTITGNKNSSIYELMNLSVKTQNKLIVEKKFSLRDRRTIVDKLHNCSGCELSKNSVVNIGKTGKKNLMICGECPNNKDGKSGGFNAGKTYEILINKFKDKNIYEEDFYWTNIIKCATFGKKIESQHLQACQQWIEKEIEYINPIIIVSIGSIAGQFFSKDKHFSIMKKNGTIMWREDYRCWIYFLIHPGLIYRDSSKMNVLESGVNILKQKLKNIGY